MTTLYSCRHAGDQYRMTKMDEWLNVESSYLCTYTECECPAGVRDTCRHRQMLPKFIARGAVNSAWLYDHDRDGWVQTDLGEALSGSVEDIDHGLSEPTNDWINGDNTAGTATASVDTAGSMALPEGVTMISLDDPKTLFDAIADAVGEPRSGLGTPPTKPFRRGL